MEAEKGIYLKKILRAQIYIQEHLEDENLKLEDIARAACLSYYHFHRIFHAYEGETLNQYIRRLKMEKAAGKLAYTKERITEIALESGYETPSSFTKAFHQVMGKAPKNYRQTNQLKSCELINKKEAKMIEAQYVELEDLPVFFVRKVGSYEKTPKEAWNALIKFAKTNGIDLAHSRYFSLGLDDPNITSKQNLRFDACLATSEKIQAHSEIGEQVLKGGRYAAFTHLGPYEKLQETFDQIFKVWFPKYEGELEDQPCLVEHLNMDLIKTDPDQLISVIFVPLKY